jgi:hypothetical protein
MGLKGAVKQDSPYIPSVTFPNYLLAPFEIRSPRAA